MRTTNCYATLAEFKAKFFPAGVTDTADDTSILNVLESISRSIDRLWEGRHYYPRAATRYFTADSAKLMLADDLLSVTTFKTDSDGDRTYETTWASTDYDLEPYNALALAPPRPYTRIVPSPNGTQRFPSTRKGIEVVGSFGFFDVRRTASVTLNEALDTTETGVDVSTSGGSEFSPGMTILIESEQMHVQSVSTNTLTVTRGANGTPAVTHNTGTAIQIYEYPVINEVCLLMAGRLHKRKDAIFGVMGAAEMGQLAAIAKHDPDVKLLMQPFQRIGV